MPTLVVLATVLQMSGTTVLLMTDTATRSELAPVVVFPRRARVRVKTALQVTDTKKHRVTNATIDTPFNFTVARTTRTAVLTTQKLRTPFGLNPVTNGAAMNWLTAHTSARMVRNAVVTLVSTFLYRRRVNAENAEKLTARRLMHMNLVTMLRMIYGPPMSVLTESLRVMLLVVLLLLFGGEGSPVMMNMVTMTVRTMLTMTQNTWARSTKVIPDLLKLGLLGPVEVAPLRTTLRTSGSMIELIVPKSRVRPRWKDLFPLLLSPTTQGP